jgi:ATP-dependent DNA ligase
MLQVKKAKNSAFNMLVCVFIFDILYIDGKSLMSTPFAERRKILEENINVIPNHIELSERKILKEEEELAEMMTTVIHDGNNPLCCHSNSIRT